MKEYGRHDGSGGIVCLNCRGENEFQYDTSDLKRGRNNDYYKYAAGKLTLKQDTETIDKLAALNTKLKQLDAYRDRLERANFSYTVGEKKYTFYADDKRINGIVTALPYLPDEYTVLWKTADKSDDINNVYVKLDKAGIAGLGIAYLSHQNTAFATMEAHKKAIKALYANDEATADDIINYSIED